MAYTPAALLEAEKDFAVRHGLPAHALAALHAQREHIASTLATDWQRMAAWVVAPVLAGFMHWLREQIRENKNALCLTVMREGRLLGNLLNNFGIEAHEAWFNRDLSMRAAFVCGDEEALLNWLVRTRMQPLTPAQATRKLSGVDYAGALPDRPLSVETARQLLAEWKKQDLLPPIKAEAQMLATNLMRHWYGLVPPGQKKVLLVDFAAAGNIQRSLQTVLRANNRHTQIVGLNFLTTSGSKWAKEAGCEIHGWLGDGGEPEWLAQAYTRTPELIEIFAAAALGPLQDYDDKGAPVCGRVFLDSSRQKRIAEAQEIIGGMVMLYDQALGAELTGELSRLIWGRALLAPLPEEAETLGDWPLDAGLDGSAQRVLAPKISGEPEQWTKMQCAWPAGSVSRHGTRG